MLPQFCHCTLVESNSVILVLVLRGILSHMAARSVLDIQRSTLAWLVMLRLTDCRAGLECSFQMQLGDIHPQRTPIWAQLRRRFEMSDWYGRLT